MARESWDEYFLGLAETVATRSKDPSTKVGAVVVGPDKEIRSTGYNGFARNINDEKQERQERPLKYLFVVHAEANSIFHAARIGVSLKGCTIYIATINSAIPPCNECAKGIIQSGISRVVYKKGEVPERWKESTDVANEMMKEAGVIVDII